MYIPHGKITGKLSYIYTFPESIRVEERDLSGMVKGPTFLSLPGHRYLKLGSKSNLQAEISGSIVWYEALALLPEAMPIYGNPDRSLFF